MKRASCFILLALGGCASQVNAVRSAADEAPAWFQERREEIRGEDYPDIRTVPTVNADTRPQLGKESGALARTGSATEFAAHPRATPPNISPADIMAWVQAKKQLFAGVNPPRPGEAKAPDLSVFDAPRGQPPASPR